MKILIYILGYLAIGGVLAWMWNEIRDEQGMKNCTFYTVLDLFLWPLPIVARMIGFVQGFMEGFIEARNYMDKDS